LDASTSDLARALGATKVMLADINGGRLKLSADAVKPDRAIDMSSENLEEIVAAETGGIGPSVIITAAPSGQAQEQAIAMAAPGGRVSFFGGLPKDKPMIQVDSNVVHYKELILAGANGSSPAQNKEALVSHCLGCCSRGRPDHSPPPSGRGSGRH
jgi:L-iditol 2-dehydrogenase